MYAISIYFARNTMKMKIVPANTTAGIVRRDKWNVNYFATIIYKWFHRLIGGHDLSFLLILLTWFANDILIQLNDM